jgi:hypothetical protein
MSCVRARRPARAREPAPTGNGVDRARLAAIRATGKHDLDAVVVGKSPGCAALEMNRAWLYTGSCLGIERGCAWCKMPAARKPREP